MSEYAVEGEWLVERTGEHTCGTGRGGHYGAHEPGCGVIPIGKVEDLLADSMLGAGLRRESREKVEPIWA